MPKGEYQFIKELSKRMANSSKILHKKTGLNIIQSKILFALDVQKS